MKCKNKNSCSSFGETTGRQSAANAIEENTMLYQNLCALIPVCF